MGEQGIVEGGVENGVEGVSPAPDVEAASSAEPTETGEVLPFGKHPRWIEMNRANKEYKAKLAEFEARQPDYEEAVAIKKWIEKDPKGFYAHFKSQIEPEQAVKAPETDPYEAFEPEVAERFKRYDKALEEAEKAKQEAQKNQQKTEKQRVANNRQELDTAFDELAKTAGFIDENGKSDEEFMDVVANATLAKLHAIAANPSMPTKKELETAFSMISKGLKSVEKKALSQKPSSVPPSGSSVGVVPNTKVKRTAEDRINDILKDL
jgi:hypothetical protein